MKVNHINIKNFKGLSKVSEDLEGCSVYLLGPNAVGKTSFIGAVWNCLTGKKLPTQPIKQGAKKGLIEVDLGDYTARLEFPSTKGKPKFSLYSGNEEIKSPRTVLADKIGIIDFNPNEFFKKSSAEQVKYFANVSGIDFGTLDNNITELREGLSFDNKNLKQKKATLEPYDAKDAKKEFIDIREATEFKANHERISEGVKEKSDRGEKIYLRIDELKKEMAILVKEIEAGSEWLRENPLDPTELDDAEETNATIKQAKEMSALENEIETIAEHIFIAKADAEELTAKKRELISEKITVPGLTFDGDQFLFDGLPFEAEQINTANQIIAGLRIGSSLLKDLRILRFEGSLLDSQNLKEVQVWATENDIQLFVELLERDGDGLEIVINES